jgi:hypothetical protein
MSIARRDRHAPWLLYTFTLPAGHASQRVEVWRKLLRYGALALGNSGYLLPNQPANQERFEWLAAAVRKYRGEASVVRVQSIDNPPAAQLIARFSEARDREYQGLIRDVQKLCATPAGKRKPGGLRRLRSRLAEIVEIDFFKSPLRKRAEESLSRADASPVPVPGAERPNPGDYVGRVWVTRTRPGIDRSASAWLIRRSIDRKARFAFAREEHIPAGSVPFDMFQGGFGHRGEDCTFETLQKLFRIHDRAVETIAQIIHDADLLDGKFGRPEGFGIDQVLNGWALEGVPDGRLLERGMQLIEALHRSFSRK